MKAESRETTMTPSLAQTTNVLNRAPSAATSDCVGFGFGFGDGFGDQYWYWFSAGVPAVGS
jgi:hypothetical protein